MLPILELCDKMASITRWSHATCRRPESVLEHTAFVAIYSYQLAIKIGADIGVVLEKAIVHDMEEIVTGDIPTPTKYSSHDMQSLIGQLEREAAAYISEDVFEGKMFEAWDDSKSLDTIEGQIIYLADIASVVYKIWAEHELGSSKFDAYINGITKRLHDAHSLFNNTMHVHVRDLLYVLEKLT